MDVLVKSFGSGSVGTALSVSAQPRVWGEHM